MTGTSTESLFEARLITDPESFSALASAWDALAARSPEKGAWYSHDWYRCWWSAFGRRSDLRIICLYRSEELVGVVPLMLTPIRFKGFSFRVLKFIENGITPRNEFIGVSFGEVEVATVWRAALGFADEWDLMILNNLSHTGATLTPLRNHLIKSGIRHVELPDRVSPFIPLDSGLAGVRDGFGKRLKRNLSNARNRLERAGGFSVETCAAPEEIARGLEQAFAVSRKSWKGRSGKDIGGNRQREEFYRVIARTFARDNRVRIWLLRHREQTIAFEYALLDRDHLLLLAIDYDQAFAEFSPGTLLRSLVLEQVVDTELSCYDFAGTNYDYKLHWTRHVRPHSQIWIFHDGLKSRLLHFVKARVLPAVNRNAATDTDSEERSERT